DLNYTQIKLLIPKISDHTIALARKKMIEIYRRLNQNNMFLGGLGTIVEADETVLSRRGIIRNPTSYDDQAQDAIWILGLIDHTNEKNNYLKRVENRRILTLTRALEGVVGVGSILYTDGHPSYPQVAENLGLQHQVVNHSLGFVAPDGTHTNLIEGFWSHLKAKMRSQHGVNIDDWLEEYSFKRKVLLTGDLNTIRENFE
ncbi:hypothetical protein DMUE_6361, partial [Dictyocoela muelleri]